MIRMKISKIYKIASFAVIFSLIIPFASSYSEEFETLQLEIKYIGGDRIDTFQANYIIYQDSQKTPFIEKNLESNPESITLPKDHKYKVEVFVNGMYTEVGYVELNKSEKLDIFIPISGGLKFNVFFEDGEKPIGNATVVIKSQDGVQQRIGNTNDNGDTMRYWLQSTSREQDYYLAEVYYDEFLLTSVSNIKIQHSIAQDQKIVVPVPAVIEELITFRLSDIDSERVLKKHGNYSVLLVGGNNVSFENHMTTNGGEIYFSSIPPGAYTVSVLKDGIKDPLWPNTRLKILGNPNNFDLFQINSQGSVSALLSDPVVDSVVSPNAEELETLQIEIKTINGDRIDTVQTNYIIYQDSQKTPFIEKNLESNPESITLPKDHKYKVEVFVNGMFGEVDFLQLNESKKLNLIIPPSGGLQLNVFFEDGEKPIDNVTYVIKSNDGNEQARGNTNENGDSLRHWIQSTNREDNYYIVEIYYEDFLLTSVSDIKIQHSVQQNHKILVPIPSVVEELITFRLFDTELNKIVNNDSNFSILLTGQENQQYQKSFISKKGEIFFSSIPSGIYTVSVLKDGVKDTHWVDSQIVISGIQNNFDLNQPTLMDTIVVPFSDPITSSVPDTLSKPVIYYQNSFKLSCECVAFQINDIQDFWLNAVQIELLNKFSQNNLPATIGVITKAIGEDPKLTEIIKNGIKNDQLEIANHSLDNEVITSYNKKEQNDIIKQSSNKISEIFNVDSKVFLPPRGEFNEDTISVLKANGYTVLSASIETDFPPYTLEGETLYRFPANVLNAEFDSIEGLIGNTGEKIFSDVKKGIDAHGFAIINFHPQEFAVKKDGVLVNELNLEQFQELEFVIQEIKKENFKVVPIGKIEENISKVIFDTSNDSLNTNFIPGWIKNIAGWWRDGHIDDDTFIQAIQYLIKGDIITIPDTFQGSGTSATPGWIKENAGWWAEGKISDSDFINDLGFLVNQ